MGPFGFWEIIVILVVALIFLGPKRLPDAARSLGRGIAEFRRASNDLRSSLNLDALDPEPFPPTRKEAPKRPAVEAPEATAPMAGTETSTPESRDAQTSEAPTPDTASAKPDETKPQ